MHFYIIKAPKKVNQKCATQFLALVLEFDQQAPRSMSFTTFCQMALPSKQQICSFWGYIAEEACASFILVANISALEWYTPHHKNSGPELPRKLKFPTNNTKEQFKTLLAFVLAFKFLLWTKTSGQGSFMLLGYSLNDLIADIKQRISIQWNSAKLVKEFLGMKSKISVENLEDFLPCFQFESPNSSTLQRLEKKEDEEERIEENVEKVDEIGGKNSDVKEASINE